MIAILKYNAGNIKSVINALARAGHEAIITDSKEELVRADKVIIPGVGHAGQAMKYLKERGLDRVILSLKQPVLGICLGLQLMCISSEEDNTECLGIFNSKVRKFPPLQVVPHMGWNNFISIYGKLFDGLKESDDMYYVHSYYAETGESTVAVCEYILPFSAAMQKDNFYATQFHPEKSGDKGEKVLRNFLSL
ncbi:MAG TPA: imidazole glycerol phosphate synthase subunit HisH [Bacteroidales bacterium]|mgnify:CR=1 FL=1|nr:imidazole glycerol phosphate synthase subunit HisH [Bacteroidales bacterium]HOK74340.1 imidazole glycerol phosphate synthase subunit HisH [Bacteroidales bacterium]HOM39864.1 imidazole glycerol phosphate synthase subunit HisH [Bacteroidales bacterium]HOU30934.1 imidazole glycerol phosphate synthase subunit HisH [Bacteroidales bacterium]HPP92805.1 imidazole glycerol phosphate synthase subunit HisH [Bacteroidales bacterium]